jgi:hypothetical protein
MTRCTAAVADVIGWDAVQVAYLTRAATTRTPEGRR